MPGVARGNVLILGGGIVGTEAAKMAAGLGANVTLLDVDLNRLRHLATVLPANVTTRFSSPSTIEELLPLSDLVRTFYFACSLLALAARSFWHASNFQRASHLPICR